MEDMVRSVMQLTCHRCKHQWHYEGRYVDVPFIAYAQCPFCKTSVKIVPEKATDAVSDAQTHA